MKYPREWEVVEELKETPLFVSTGRLKIPGGWLVRNVIINTGYGLQDIRFITDPKHEWELEEEK